VTDKGRGHFQGLFDSFAEMGRMREHWQQIEPSADARTQASPWSRASRSTRWATTC